MLKGIHLTLMVGPVVPVPVDREIIEALQSVEVTTSAGQRSGFQLSFAIGKRSVLVQRGLASGMFDPMVRVIIVTTINGVPQVIMDGLIARQQLTPSNMPGQSTLTITGEDLSQAMDLVDFSGFKFPAIPKEGRVALMIAKYAMFGIVPLIVPSVLFEVPNPLEQIPTQTGTDLAYIHELANEVGYVFYIDPGPRPGLNVAYWGPEIKSRAPQPALSVNMDAHSNVESLSFSFDGLSKTQYFMTIQNLSSKLPIPIPIPDITPLNPPLGRKPPLPFHIKPISAEKDSQGMAKHTPLQAAAIGLAKASRSTDVISGTGSLDVLRYGRVLKARQLVGVRGAGRVYDGLYYVKSVTHSIKAGQYKQSFTLSRNALVSSVQRVPT